LMVPAAVVDQTLDDLVSRLADRELDPVAIPREWLAASSEIVRFAAAVVRDVWGLRVFRFFGEALRLGQAGIIRPVEHLDGAEFV